MKLCREVPLLLLIASCAIADPGPPSAKTADPPHKPQTSSAAPARSVAVYVSDFELDIFHGKGTGSASPRNPANTSSDRPSGTAPSTSRTAPSSAPSSNAQSAASLANRQLEETPTEQAKALVDAMSESLVKALEKAGYKARRLRAGEDRPPAGMRIRGVFAEPDEQNRVRRLLVGGIAVTPKMLLFVGVNDLARPDQPLYELANPPSKDSRHGPVITVTSYAPVSRFELDRKPAEMDINKIATQIAADLTGLLNSNPLSAEP